MILIENLRVRLREWMEADEEPDLVSRFRRLWHEDHETERPRLAPPASPPVGLHPARVWHLRRAS